MIGALICCRLPDATSCYHGLFLELQGAERTRRRVRASEIVGRPDIDGHNMSNDELKAEIDKLREDLDRLGRDVKRAANRLDGRSAKLEERTEYLEREVEGLWEKIKNVGRYGR